MTKEERKNKALEYIERHKLIHVERKFCGPQEYHHKIYVINMLDAKHAIEIALVETK